MARIRDRTARARAMTRSIAMARIRKATSLNFETFMDIRHSWISGIVHDTVGLDHHTCTYTETTTTFTTPTTTTTTLSLTCTVL